MSFSEELAKRLISHKDFHVIYNNLQIEGAASAIIGSIDRLQSGISDEDIATLIYCASVFVQTDNDALLSNAQSIALNVILLNRNDDFRLRCLRILTDVGNFPALTYAEEQKKHDLPLVEIVRRAISREVNAITINKTKIYLTDFQKKSWDMLSNTHTVAISAPTSAGKSFLVIEHLCRSAKSLEQFSAVYIAPTRALLSEVFSTIKSRMEDTPEVRISTIPNEDSENSERQIYVLTQERLQVLLAISAINFDMIIVDEAQNVSDGSRGMILQECLEQSISRNPNTRVVMLAPGAQGFARIQSAIGLENINASMSHLPSVIQNRILVNKDPSKDALDLSLLTADGIHLIGTLNSQRGFELPESRLAAVALELGQHGGSLVYSTGPKNAEKVATQISFDSAVIERKNIDELSKFIKDHIHPEYSLCDLVRKGVAFHYGKMPTLLRESLESSFKAGDLRYLVCTTTLFQGVNLPARNVFIDTPTRGKDTKLDPAALWNFAGRAGRMKADIVGNVFLVDYNDWPEKPMNEFVGYKIEPAFEKTISDNLPEVIAALSGNMPRPSLRDETPDRLRAAAGLLISRATKGDVHDFLERSLSELSEEKRFQLAQSAEHASRIISLPSSILSTNWTVNPFGLRKLFDHICNKIQQDDLDDLIPINPHNEKDAKKRYSAIFMRIEREVNGSISSFPAVVAGYAVQWMRGIPYPVILSGAIEDKKRKIEKQTRDYEEELEKNPKTRKRPPRPLDINEVVHSTFEIIEDLVRFKYVQLGKAYVELLALAMKELGKDKLVKDIFDFPLAMELGIGTKSGWAFMELGLSRIAASTLAPLFPNSNLSTPQARKWLKEEVDVHRIRLSQVIIDELTKLNLINTK